MNIMRNVIVPYVHHELDVNSMNHAFSLSIYSYFTSRYGVQWINTCHQHHSKLRRQRNEVMNAQMDKNSVMKRLRQMRREGSNPA